MPLPTMRSGSLISAAPRQRACNRLPSRHSRRGRLARVLATGNTASRLPRLLTTTPSVAISLQPFRHIAAEQGFDRRRNLKQPPVRTGRRPAMSGASNLTRNHPQRGPRMRRARSTAQMCRYDESGHGMSRRGPLPTGATIPPVKYVLEHILRPSQLHSGGGAWI